MSHPPDRSSAASSTECPSSASSVLVTRGGGGGSGDGGGVERERVSEGGVSSLWRLGGWVQGYKQAIVASLYNIYSGGIFASHYTLHYYTTLHTLIVFTVQASRHDVLSGESAWLLGRKYPALDSMKQPSSENLEDLFLFAFGNSHFSEIEIRPESPLVHRKLIEDISAIPWFTYEPSE